MFYARDVGQPRLSRHVVEARYVPCSKAIVRRLKRYYLVLRVLVSHGGGIRLLLLYSLLLTVVHLYGLAHFVLHYLGRRVDVSGWLNLLVRQGELLSLVAYLLLVCGALLTGPLAHLVHAHDLVLVNHVEL